MNKRHKETKKAINTIFKYYKKHHSSDAIAYHDTTPIYISYSRSEAGKISYITERKLKSLREHVDDFKINNENRKKYFFHTTPLKFFRKFYNVDGCGYDYETKVAHLEYILGGWDKMNLTKVAPQDIPQLYQDANVIGSCMSDKPLSYFEIYTKLISGGGYSIELGGDIIGRFLYYTRSIGGTQQMYIDRIYLNTDNNNLKDLIYQKIYNHFINSFDNIKGYNVSHLSSQYREKSNKISYGGFPYIEVSCDCSELDFYPYMDTYKYLDRDGIYLYKDEDRDADKILDCTDGRYNEHEKRCCECCGAELYEEDEIFCEDVDETRCESCAVWSEADNAYYAEENCTYISGNVESYVHNDDIG